MNKLTLYPGEFVFDSSGSVIYDSNNNAIITDAIYTLEIPDKERYLDAVRFLNYKRLKDNIFDHNYLFNIWLMQSDIPANKYSYFAQIKDSDHFQVKYSCCLCNKTCGVLADTYTNFIPQMVPKKQQKIKKVTEKVEVMQTVQKTVTQKEIIFDEATQRYIQKNVETQVPSEEPIIDEFPLYDENDQVIGTHKAPRMEDKTTETPLFNQDGTPQMEEVLDASGNLILVPEFEVRYIDENGNETTPDAGRPARLVQAYIFDKTKPPVEWTRVT
jgi:hypothetical protein